MKRFRLCVRNFLVVLLLVSFLVWFGFLGSYQNILQDKLYGGSARLENIIIVAIDDKSIQEIGRWPWNRSVIASLINKSSDARVVGVDITFAEPSSDDLVLADTISNSNVVLPIEYSPDRSSPLKPLSIFRAKVFGVSNLVTDSDGVTRAAATVFSEPLFSEAIASLIGVPPLPKNQRVLINTIGPRGSFRTVSAVDVLKNDFDFSNKVVLIGATAPDLHDDYIVPTSDGTRVSGVEVHANLLQMLLTRRFLVHEPFWSVLAFVFLFTLIAVVITSVLHTVAALISSVLFLFVYWFVAVWVFNYGIVADMIYAPLALLFGVILNTASLHMHERKEKREVLDAFGKYVSPEIVKELFKHPDKLKLGGERRIVTIFFSDVRGFTTISEQLSPEQLVSVLNEYLTVMTDIIMSHGGVVDKYIGDAIMAFWNAPLDQPDHADRACAASLEMIDKLKLLQESWKQRGLPNIDIGIGINTGHAVIGNMGSHQRFNYTAMGDTINLGSRLEGLTKEYKVNIIISEATKKMLSSNSPTRELDLVCVKGKKEPIRIYELCSKVNNVALSYFSKGLDDYRKGKFLSAKKSFKKALLQGDKTSEVFVKRCDHLLKHSVDWDGVWTMHTK